MTNLDYDVSEVDKKLNRVIQNLDTSFLQYCKSYFEENLLYFYGNKLELTLIVDANIIISEALAYVKNNKSFLLNLSKSLFLKLLAPSWLKQELERKIPEVSRQNEIDENKLRSVVSMLSEKISIVEVNEMAYQIAFAKIGQRDEKDVPYVALYFSVKSHGILTKDKDITDIQEIKTWVRPGIAGKVVSIFERGAFSFLLVGKGVPTVFRFLYETFVIILRSVWEVVKMVTTAIYSFIREGFKTVSRFPDWIKVLIGTGVILLILWDRSREVIFNTLQSFVQGVVSVLTWFYDITKSILNFIAPLIEGGLTFLAFLFTKIDETIAMYKQINFPSEGGIK